MNSMPVWAHGSLWAARVGLHADLTRHGHPGNAIQVKVLGFPSQAGQSQHLLHLCQLTSCRVTLPAAPLPVDQLQGHPT